MSPRGVGNVVDDISGPRPMSVPAAKYESLRGKIMARASIDAESIAFGPIVESLFKAFGYSAYAEDIGACR